MAIPQTLLPRKTREQWDHRYLPRCVLGFRSALGSCQIISVINPGKSSYRDHGMPCRRIFTPSSYFPPILRLPKCNLHVSIIFWKGILVLTGVVHLSIIKSKAKEGSDFSFITGWELETSTVHLEIILCLEIKPHQV